MIFFHFHYISILLIISKLCTTDFIKLCETLNNQGSSCTFSLDTFNLKNIKITLKNLEIIEKDFFNHLNLSHLELNQVSINGDFFEKLSTVQHIKNFFLTKVKNISQALQDKKILKFLNKITSVSIKQAIDIQESEIISILTQIDLLGTKEFTIELLNLPILRLDLFNLEKISTLNIYNCVINNLQIQLGEKINILNIYSNNMSTIVIKSNLSISNLVEMKLIGNNLDSIYLPMFSNLKKFYLDQNNLKTIDKNSFTLFKSLEILSLIFNKIEFIENGSFNNFEHLDHLFLTGNLLNESVRFNFRSLQYLNLDNNKFTYFSSFLNLNNSKTIKYLHLSFNMIETLILDLPALESLHVSYNRLKIIDSTGGIIFYLSSNFINVSELSLNSLKNKIMLSQNSIKHLNQEDLQKFENTTELNLSLNQIRDIQFPVLNNLKILIISNNNLFIIKKDTFKNLFNLTILNLSFNRILFIEADSFMFNTNLEYIYLNNNNFKEIPNFFHLLKIKYLNLNYLHNMKELKKNAFGNFSNTFSLQIDFLFNNLKFVNSKVFCSDFFKNILFFTDNTTLIDKCSLGQLKNRNFTFQLSGPISCDFFKMSLSQNISVKGIDSNCDSYILIDDCNYDFNQQFNCLINSDQDEFKIFEIYSSDFCDLVENFYCLKTEFLLVNCSTKISNSNTSYGHLNNYFYELLDKDSNFVIAKFFQKSVLIYHKNSQTLVLIKNENKSFSLILKVKKFLFENLSGLIKTGCYRNNKDTLWYSFKSGINVYSNLSDFLDKFVIKNQYGLLDPKSLSIDLNQALFPNQTVGNSISQLSVEFLSFLLIILFLELC